MIRITDDGPGHEVPWLPDEQFELALDAQLGAATSPTLGNDVLTVTSHRAIKISSDGGRRTTSFVPLSQLTAVEVVDVARSTQRAAQGLFILGIGVLLGWLSWIVVNVTLISLLVGGLPVLAAIYLLAGYALPDTDGQLLLHARGHVLLQQLRSKGARRDAYLMAHRLCELMTGGAGRVEAATPEPQRPAESPLRPAPRWLAAWAPSVSEAAAPTSDVSEEPVLRPFAAREKGAWPEAADLSKGAAISPEPERQTPEGSPSSAPTT